MSQRKPPTPLQANSWKRADFTRRLKGARAAADFVACYSSDSSASRRAKNAVQWLDLAIEATVAHHSEISEKIKSREFDDAQFQAIFKGEDHVEE